jgi:hypothetical protein
MVSGLNLNCTGLFCDAEDDLNVENSNIELNPLSLARYIRMIRFFIFNKKILRVSLAVAPCKFQLDCNKNRLVICIYIYIIYISYDRCSIFHIKTC